MPKSYQTNYAHNRPQMYDYHSRSRKAKRIIKTLANHFGSTNLKKLSVLDTGSSSGIIDYMLADKFARVVGIDIDKQAVSFAKQSFRKANLKFQVGDALKLNFPASSFDVVICTHIYEHVSNPQKLFDEIYRVLKPTGVCYLAAVNKLWPIEAHYNLPFLSWLPKSLANPYIRATGKAHQYYETMHTYWTLKRLTQQFKVIELTQIILRHPNQYGFDDILPAGHPLTFLAMILSPAAKYLSPTFFWLLQKGP